MNYLELINKCLVELNYKKVNTFAELVKNDHKKIMNILNLVNMEVCRYDKWNFLLRTIKLTLPKNTNEIENQVPGRISLVLIDNAVYNFCEDFKKFLTNTQTANTYCEFGNKLLFPNFTEDKTIEVIYFTENNAKDIEGNEQFALVNESDCPLIPESYVEPILVFGTCMRLKASPKHVKFSYWLSMYKDALSNLRSKNCVNADYAPSVKLNRQ